MVIVNNNEIARHILIGINSFCSGVVHELRSPVQAIENSLIILEHMLEDTDDESALMAIRNIQSSTEAINQILSNMTAMGNGGESMESHDAMAIILKDIKEGNLADTVREAVDLFQLTTTHKECQATLELKCPKEAILEYSAFAVRQVIINLISNASKSCRKAHGRGKGKIKVKLEVKDSGEVHVRVSDNGTGISEDVMDKIFLPFYRADTSIPGKGIGLHLSRLWAEYAGMALNLAKSRPGNTEFILAVKYNNDMESQPIES